MMKFIALPAPRRRVAVAGALFAAALLGGCNATQPATLKPLEVTRDTPCSLDGMTLSDYPGPKAQIVYEQGAADFFCDTIEMFSVVLRPEQKRRIGAIYVQDMGQAAWDEPKGHWIDARAALYVAGSRRHGSMGATLASFASEADARAFAAKEGGQVYRFEQVTPAMAVLDGGVLKDHQM